MSSKTHVTLRPSLQVNFDLHGKIISFGFLLGENLCLSVGVECGYVRSHE